MHFELTGSRAIPKGRHLLTQETVEAIRNRQKTLQAEIAPLEAQWAQTNDLVAAGNLWAEIEKKGKRLIKSLNAIIDNGIIVTSPEDLRGYGMKVETLHGIIGGTYTDDSQTGALPLVAPLACAILTQVKAWEQEHQRQFEGSIDYTEVHPHSKYPEVRYNVNLYAYAV